jgi:hypothetical protein
MMTAAERVKAWRKKNPARAKVYRVRYLKKKGKQVGSRPPQSKTLGTFDQRLTDNGTYLSLHVQSKWGVQEVLFNHDLLDVVKSAISVRVFDSTAGGHGKTEKLYAQLLWRTNKKITCLYLYRIAAGVVDAGRGIHCHHTSAAVSTLDCRREVLSVLTASEHGKLRGKK